MSTMYEAAAPTRPATRSTAVVMSRRSAASMSGVEKRVSSVRADTVRPSLVRMTADLVPASRVQRSESMKRSTPLADIGDRRAVRERSQMPWMTSRRPNVDRFFVSPSGPARCSNIGVRWTRPVDLGVRVGVEAVADLLAVEPQLGRPMPPPMGEGLRCRQWSFMRRVAYAASCAERAESRPVLGHVGFDLVASGGELVDDLHRDLGEVGDAAAHRPPFDADGLGELVAEFGFVEVADGLGPVVERSGVEGGPSVVGSVDEVGDDHVGVEVGVAGTGGAMSEHGGDEPVASTTSAPPWPRRPLDASVSKTASASRTATSWAWLTAERMSGVPRPWRIDTDFGAQNVASNAVTVGADLDAVILTLVPGY